jgi:hypothetical protein
MKKIYSYPEYDKVYNATEKARLTRKKYAEEHKDKMRHYAIRFYWRNREKISAKRKLLKVEVLTHYGNGKLQCVTCFENRIDCLSLDHINGRGKQHRSIVGSHMYQWVKNNNYPEGYQTLCMNCQWIKRVVNKELIPKPRRLL